MGYKEKYEQALEQAKKELKTCGSYDCDTARQIFRFFPELKESDDERIRKELLDYLDERRVVETHTDTRIKEEWISWLEKQNKPQGRTGMEWDNTIDDACNHRYAEEYAHGEYCHEQSFKGGFQEGVDWLEKQNVPAFIYDMPKIEFNVDDWVIFKYGGPESVYKVEKIENYEYTLRHILGGSMPLPFGSQGIFRHWTIQDAKEGDVLVCENKRPFIFKDLSDPNHPDCPVAYCGIDYENSFIVSPGVNFWWTDDNVEPATKEQRDILFQKMEKAGYTWDAEKKELTKL